MKVNVSKTVLIFSALILVLVACSENKTPGGVKYTVIRKGDGVEPPYGKYLVMNLTLKDSKDSVWFESSSTGYPIIVPVQDESMVNDEGEYGVFKALTKGDSVTFKIPARIVFLKTRKRAVPENIDPLSMFQFNVGLKDVLTLEEVNVLQDKMMLDNRIKHTKDDTVAIRKFVTENNMNVKVTASGLYYEVRKEGTGEFAKTGQTAMVNYAGYLLTGELFDTNIQKVAEANNYNNGGRYNPYPVVVNTSVVIDGWDEMLLLMNKGMEVRVFIPSALAYGGQGSGAIPPYSILVFDMEVVDIKP